MLFRRGRQREREALRRLTDWALGQRAPEGELERLYGREHAAELGPLAWLFRAIELEPVVVPTLGQWQRFEKELRQRLALLPPPRSPFGGMMASVFFLPAIDPAAMRGAVSEMTWKSAAVAATTTALTVQLLSVGAAEGVERGWPGRDVPDRITQFSPTGNVMIDRFQMNAIALTPGGLDPVILARPDRGVPVDES